MLIAYLKAEWPHIAAAYDDTTLAQLDAAYSEPHRQYHAATHIIDLLEKLKHFARHAHCPNLIAHAILWHDVVYKNPAVDPENVKQSVDAFLIAPSTLCLHDKRVVAEMIAATDGHKMRIVADEARMNDMALFLDLDLSILAADADKYDAYEAGIFFEYPPAPLGAQARGRATFLEKYAQKDPLFFHPATAAAFKDRAIDNMRRAAIKWRLKATELGFPMPGLGG